jgi:outer membrane protein assembly factor BamB
LRKFVSGIMFALLLTSMLAATYKVQPASVNASLREKSVQTEGVDWWPMFHHDLMHTGYSTSTTPSTNQTLWKYTTGDWVVSSPTVANSVVYVGSLDYNVYALNAATGALTWKYTTGSYVYSSPAVANGIAYIGSDDYNVYAINATTGTFKWRYTTGAQVRSSPAVANGVVYVGSMDDRVYALNAATGALVWRYTTNNSVWSSPAVANGVVYVGSCDDNVYALNATTGAFKWKYTTGNWVHLASPAVANGMVYIGSDDYNVYALNAATGALIWKYTTGSYVYSAPAVANGVVYVGSLDDKVYALNAATGALIWKYATGWVVYSSPAIANGIVYVGSFDDKVYAFGVLHDLAVVNVIPTQRLVLPGNGINITVQVKNKGGYPETSNVTLYAGSTLLGVHYGVFLNPGELATFAFGWNTAAFSPDCYLLKASVAPVPYEVDLGNNVDVNGTVIIGVRTPTGTNVTVSPAPNLQLTFTQTISAGVTTLNVTQPPSTTLTAAANSVFVNIQTNATYSGNVTLQFVYNATGLTLEDQKAIKIWLWNQTSSTWRDITTYVNTTSNVVYGVSPHLSMFGVTCTLSLTDYNGYQTPTTVGTPPSPPPLPSYLEDLAYFDIQATAQYASPVFVRLAYDPSTISQEQALFLQMWVWNGIMWVDITTKVDTISHVIYGVSPHLSMFGITTFNPQVVTGATPIAGIAGISGYKLLFKETVGNPFGSAASVDYHWSFSVEKWSGTQWIATAISGSSSVFTGYFIPTQTTADLPYCVYVLPSSGSNAVAWGDWLRISYSFHWTYSGVSYSTAYTAELHVHPPDIAGGANTVPYYGSDGNVGPPDLGVISPNWKKTVTGGTDPTSNLAKADIDGDNYIGPADLGKLSARWKQTWTNTPPPG